MNSAQWMNSSKQIMISKFCLDFIKDVVDSFPVHQEFA